MPIPTCAVTCTFVDVNDNPVANAEVVARLSKAEVYEGIVVPLRQVGMTDDDGVIVFDLWPNELGAAGTHYNISLHVGGLNVSEFKAYIPKDTPAVNLEDHLVDRDFNPPPVLITGPEGPPGPPGVPPEKAGMVGKTVAGAGLRMCVIGASTEARAHPQWNVPAANYQRVSGVATVVMQYSLADQYFLDGQRIRLACANRPDVEGTFTVVSCTVSAGVSTTITYADARADVAANTLGGTAAVHDLCGWSVPAGWPMHANLAADGRLDTVVVATGSTNVIDDWGADRVAQIVAQGSFDIVLIGSGILGNALKGLGAGPDDTYDALRTLVELIRDEVEPRLILVEELPATRDVLPTDAVFTAGMVLNRQLCTDLGRAYPFVRVVASAEVMAQNWSAYNATPSDDVLNGWPEENALASDNIHPAYAWSWLRGGTIAETLSDLITRWAMPAMALLPDTRLVNNVADPDGEKNGNVALGLWGNVAAGQTTMTNPGCSGNGPAGSVIGFTSGRVGSNGGSSAVSVLRTKFEGGVDWVIDIDGLGSSQGFVFAAELAPASLLTMLNDASVQGRWLDLWLPLSLAVQENGVLWVSVDLVATTGGREYRLASPQANAGQFSQGALGRAMDSGYSGQLKPPRFFLPAKVYTAASYRVTVKERPGDIASGRTTLVWGPEQRLQVVG